MALEARDGVGMDLGGVVVGSVGLLMAGVAVVVVTRAAGAGRIDVNAAIGIRTKATKSSQRAWEVAHRAALPWTRVAFLLTAATSVTSVIAVVLADSVGSSRAAPVVVLGAGYAGLLVLMTTATSVANRAVEADAEPDEGSTSTTDR